MKESARLLGQRLGLSSQETNHMLKEEGFLEGKPGNYNLTEKGKEFGEYSAHDNGYGGYAHRSWGFPIWDSDKVLSSIDTSPEKIEEYRNSYKEAKALARLSKPEPDSTTVIDEPLDNESGSSSSLGVAIALGIAALGLTAIAGLLKVFGKGDNSEKEDIENDNRLLED